MHARAAAVIGAAAAFAAAARGPGAALLAAARAPGASAALAAAAAAAAAAACGASAARPAAAAAAGARLAAATTAAYAASAPAASAAAARLAATASAAYAASAPAAAAAAARLAAAAGAAFASSASPASASAASTPASASSSSSSSSAAAAAASPAACAAASDRVLRSALRSPFRSYTREGLYTVELPAPPPRARGAAAAAASAVPTLVLLHGYGMGSAIWAPALDALALRFKVFAVDLRGCGASERPAWPRAEREAPGGRVGVAEAETWFVDSLERWRAASGAELTAPAVVVGHSLGGYVAAAYALRHPAKVRHLVLASPAGVPAAPAPGSEEARRFDERVASHWVLGPLSWAWERGVTPQGLVSAAGPWARARVGEVFDRRFGERMQAALEPRGVSLDRAALAEYLYLINSTSGSGDAALSALLSFGAVARSAVGPRLVALAGEAKAPPTTLVYGKDFDWMPSAPGFDTAEKMRASGVDAACLLTPRAGHNLFLDNPDAFAEQVVARCAT